MTIQEKAQSIASRSPWGWGHTINFGDFVMPGLFGTSHEIIVNHLTTMGWLPTDLSNLRLADVGCFTGGIAKILAERHASVVFAIDEIPTHTEQCQLVKDAFDLSNIRVITDSLYQLPKFIQLNSLDLIILSGVLYHCSDMLVALLTLRDLLKPSGTLLIESFAVNDFEKSYANFGRFFAGAWWQPSALCISDLCEFSGFNKPEIKFHDKERCFTKAVKNPSPIPFKRGMNYQFANIHDEKPRPTDASIMRPA
jgi:SAM-dependent methyltransferase